MSPIKFEEAPRPGNEKYPQLLAQIKAEQLASTKHRGLWAKIREYESEGTARDLAWRLGKVHEEFEFTARKGKKVTVVYARLREGVTE